jgi:Holliday junction resolvase RusA-like endonuclease
MYNPTTIKNADGSKKPHPIVAFKATVRMAAEQAYKGPPLEVAIRVDCLFVMPRPMSLLKKKSPEGRIGHTSKPDRDNLDKAILDSLNGLLWVDDCQICAGEIEKVYQSRSEQPHVVVTVGRYSVDGHCNPN